MSSQRQQSTESEPADDQRTADTVVDNTASTGAAGDVATATSAREIGGRPGPDPTRYGDWEKNGRCIDF